MPDTKKRKGLIHNPLARSGPLDFIGGGAPSPAKPAPDEPPTARPAKTPSDARREREEARDPLPGWEDRVQSNHRLPAPLVARIKAINYWDRLEGEAATMTTLLVEAIAAREQARGRPYEPHPFLPEIPYAPQPVRSIDTIPDGPDT